MPFIVVRMIEGRAPEKVEALIGALTETAARVLEAPPESVRVIVEEVPKTHWGIGGRSASALGR